MPLYLVFRVNYREYNFLDYPISVGINKASKYLSPEILIQSIILPVKSEEFNFLVLQRK